MNFNKKYSALVALSSIMSIRMMGLFMILPVFAIYAAKIPDATSTLIGIALGTYGLTQALFQIPLGMLSDRFGRKPIIFAGLVILVLGSIIAALSHSIYFLILGRALQGAGAIGSTVMALLSDITHEEFRSKAMAFIGLCIGSSFMIAMIFGPIIANWYQLAGIFWLTAAFAVVGMILLFQAVPTPAPLAVAPTFDQKFSTVLHNKQLLTLNAGIFCLHTILTALFIVVPVILSRQIQLSQSHQIIFYVSILLLSFIAAVPLIVFAEKKHKVKATFSFAIAVLIIVQVGLFFFHSTLFSIACLLFLFFAAFTFLEALLPSLVSKTAHPTNRGAAMGVYSSCQFLGIFCGGVLGGLLFSHAQFSGVFGFCAALATLWLLIATRMQLPQKITKSPNTNCETKMKRVI